jgi:hypothetical protein
MDLRKKGYSSRSIAIGLDAFLSVVVGSFVLLNWNLNSPREWSVLQAAERQYRDVPDAVTPATLTFGEGRNQLTVARLRSGHGARVWVLLNARSDPLYKRLPEEDVLLTSDELGVLEARSVLNSVVRAELMKARVDRVP